MPKTLTLPLLAGTALALAGCNQAPETTDNAMVNAENALPAEDANFSNAEPIVEEVSDAPVEAVTVAEVPAPPADAPAAETAPLADAAAIEDAIRAGTGIERIRYGDGWAWRRGGRIIRTAGRDGQEVAYFRPGESQPFYVQRGGRSYGYSNGRVTREYDRSGRPRAPDADRRREAEDAARDARERRDRAEEARSRAERPDRDGGRERPRASPSPSPTARDRDRRARPSPSPSPTDRRRRDDAHRDGEERR